MSDVTRLLDAVAAGDRQAATDLLPLVYDELRKLAAARMAAEVPGHTLDATASRSRGLLAAQVGDQQFDGRGHFFAAAAEAMRAYPGRTRLPAGKAACISGGNRRRVELADLPAATPPDELLALDEALDRLAERDSAKAEVVKLRFFAGLTMPEVAAVLGISVATAERHRAFAPHLGCSPILTTPQKIRRLGEGFPPDPSH